MIFHAAQLLISSSWRDIFQVLLACNSLDLLSQEDFLCRQLKERAEMHNQSCTERRGKWKQKSRKRGQKYEKKKKNHIYSAIALLGILVFIVPPPPLTRACNKGVFPNLWNKSCSFSGWMCVLWQGLGPAWGSGSAAGTFLGEIPGVSAHPRVPPHKLCRPSFQRWPEHSCGVGKLMQGRACEAWGLLFQSNNVLAISSKSVKPLWKSCQP